MNKRKLYKELISSGANDKEAADLANIAESLKGIKSKGLSDNAKSRILSNIAKEPKNKTKFKWTYAGGALAAACFVIVVTANNINQTPSSQPMDLNNEMPKSNEQIAPEEETLLQQMEDLETLKKEEAPLETIEEKERRYEDAVREYWKKYRLENEDNNNYWEWWEDKREERNRKKDNNKTQRYNYYNKDNDSSWRD